MEFVCAQYALHHPVSALYFMTSTTMPGCRGKRSFVAPANGCRVGGSKLAWINMVSSDAAQAREDAPKQPCAAT